MKRDFSRDLEFSKILSRQPDADITVASLEIARDAYPNLDFAAVLGWIAARASEVAGAMVGARNEADGIRELGHCLADQHGLKGCRESYDQADGSFLHRVIAQRTGIPISLSVLYMAVSNRVGWTLQGVSSPGHFLTRYESTEGPLFVDAFAQGAVLTLKECVQRVSVATGLPASETVSLLEPVGPRSIIIRMLNNLKALYAKQEDWPSARVVQQRLVALQPASYSERRDLALLSLQAQQPGEALDLLEACLHECPPDEREVLERQRTQAQRQVACWN